MSAIASTGTRIDPVGLAGLGKSGCWEVSVDEGPRNWSMQIEGRTAFLSFEIKSPAIVSELLDFLVPAGDSSPPSEITLNSNHDETISLARDDEFADRCFLIVETNRKLVMRLTLAGADLSAFVDALRQANEDIAN